MDTYLRSKLSGYVGIINLLWAGLVSLASLCTAWPKWAFGLLIAANVVALAWKYATGATLPPPDVKPQVKG